METSLLKNEVVIRIIFFAGIFLIMALWELVTPRRTLLISKPLRWSINFSIVFLDSLLIRLLFPVTAIGVAAYADIQHWGLFNTVTLNSALTIILSVIILDFIIYLQHRLFHAIPYLWRIHMMHHTDLDFDVTTGARFHPVEIIFSMVIKMGAIILLGAPPIAVLIFEVLLNATSMFNHSNINIPVRVDRFLRWLIVTPDMHRVHHSAIKNETNSNYGFNLPWWDRLLGSYVDQPRYGHLDMIIGLEDYRDQKNLSLPRLLVLPVTAKLGQSPDQTQ